MSSEIKKLQVMCADDHVVAREGLRAMVESQPDMEVVCEAASGSEAIEKFRRHQPDVLVLDLRMPDGTGHDVIRAVMSEFPSARIIVLTSHDGDQHIRRALQAGAKGYLFKDLVRAELLDAIRAVSRGKLYVPVAVASKLPPLLSRDELTPREAEVLRHAGHGLSNKEIAAAMHISDLTVKAHLQNAFSKLDARDRTHAVTIALKRGLFEL